MHVFTCPGLPASWVNAWLAGIGVTVLAPRIRLHWTAEDAPVAVLSSVERDPVEALLDAWPDVAFLRELPVTDSWNSAGELKRKVSVEQFVARVRKARGHPFAWTLSSTMTDLSIDQNGEVAHAPFDPAGPGTTKWLHSRLLRTHELAGSVSEERLRDSLLGQANRLKNYGLGFDSTRLGSLADASDPWIEPVCQRRLKIWPRGGAKDCHLGWWSELGVRLGFGDAAREFFGGSGQRSHAELKRSAPAGRPQGGMVYRVGVGLSTRASEARCRPGPGDGVPQFSYRHCFCGRGSG